MRSDVLNNEQRKHCMSRIKSKDTTPEKTVRSLITRMGYRYRLHKKHLPGTPDLVFTRRRKAIFVHGCFWHSHDCRFGRVRPKTNADFWEAKRNRTIQRDSENLAALEADGWKVLVVWECETKDIAPLLQKIADFLL